VNASRAYEDGGGPRGKGVKTDPSLCFGVNYHEWVRDFGLSGALHRMGGYREVFIAGAKASLVDQGEVRRVAQSGLIHLEEFLTFLQSIIYLFIAFKRQRSKAREKKDKEQQEFYIMKEEIMNDFDAGKAYKEQEEVFFDDGREIELLHFIYAKPNISEIRGSPERVLAAIDEYARTKRFLMNVGEDKGRIVCDLIAETKPKVMVSSSTPSPSPSPPRPCLSWLWGRNKF
jgi:hypothetical protein